MKKFIAKIQKKSRSTRLLILWLVTFLIMLAVIVIWLFTFSKNFNSAELKKEESREFPSLFESIGKDFSVFKQSLRANIQEIYGE